MKAEIKTTSKLIAQHEKEREGFADRTFLIIAENKKGKDLPLIVEFRDENDIDILLFNKNGYKVIENIKLKALIDNPIVKGVAGTNVVALKVKKLINDEMSQKERMEIVASFKNINKNDVISTVESILTNKILQKAEEKHKFLSEQSEKDIDNRFMIVYNHEIGRIYLNAIQKDGVIFLENPLLKEVGKMEMSIDDLVNNDDVVGVYGSSQLVEKLNSLRGNKIKLQVSTESLSNNEEKLVSAIKGEEIDYEKPNNNKSTKSSDIEGVLKEITSPKTKRSNNKNKK
jgi:hypothetical protein